jgi:hypothetical protein
MLSERLAKLAAAERRDRFLRSAESGILAAFGDKVREEWVVKAGPTIHFRARKEKPKTQAHKSNLGHPRCGDSARSEGLCSLRAGMIN